MFNLINMTKLNIGINGRIPSFLKYMYFDKF